MSEPRRVFRSRKIIFQAAVLVSVFVTVGNLIARAIQFEASWRWASETLGSLAVIWLFGLPLGWVVGRILPSTDWFEIGEDGITHCVQRNRLLVSWGDVQEVRIFPAPLNQASVLITARTGAVIAIGGVDDMAEVVRLIRAGVPAGATVREG